MYVVELQLTAADALRPDPDLTVSGWADLHRHLTTKESPEPGPWRTERVPYMREIMDCLSPSSPVNDLCFMKSAQVGGSEAGFNWIGFVIHHAPGPMLAVQPTVEIAERVSRQRIAPMIENSPAIRAKVGAPRSRDGGNTLLSKEFPGGILLMAGANSAAGLRSMPIGALFLDEIDAYPADVDGEGDPVALAEQRTQNFRRAKRFKNSTPTLKGFSRIEQEYEESDQRRFWVPCPDCGAHQVLRWKQVQWLEGEPEHAMYVCEHCGTLWDDTARRRAVQRGEWRAEHPERLKRGYHIWAAYSPWVRLAALAAEFAAAKKHPERLKTFVNTKLGETWEERGQSVNAEGLAARAERWLDADGERIEVPDGVGILTGAVDVQDDRLEVLIRGWGAEEESWDIAHHRLYGDPTRQEVWERLEAIRTRIYRHQSGAPLRIAAMCIDSGHKKNEVYAYVRIRQKQGVWAVKGAKPEQAEPVKVSKSKNDQGVKLALVGTVPMKDTLMPRLGQATPGEPGYIHFRGPDRDWHNGCDAEYFAQLGREKKVPKRGASGTWVRMYVKTGANEAIDLQVYNLAALHLLGPNARANLGAWAAQLEKWSGALVPQTSPRRKKPRVLSRGVRE